MTRAKHGDTVRFHYTGKLTDGTEFDSSRERGPLQVRLGAGELIPGLESKLEGMEVGAAASVTVRAADAYGERNAANVHQVPRTKIPDGVTLDRGTQLRARTHDGHSMTLTVVDVRDDSVTLDGNHPLAGRDLVFDVELLEIVNAA